MASITINPINSSISFEIDNNITGDEKLIGLNEIGKPSTIYVNQILNKIDNNLVDKVENQVIERIEDRIEETNKLSWNEV